MGNSDTSANGPYTKYVRELDWPKDEWNDAADSSDSQSKPFLPPSLFINGKLWPLLDKHIEVFVIGAPCGTFPPDPDSKPGAPPTYLFADDDDEAPKMDADSGAHTHRHQETYLFLGTNPDDPRDLGGELELWVGAGKYAEKLTKTRSSIVALPAGLAAHPMVFRRVDRPIVKVVIYDSPVLDLFPVGVWPPDFHGSL